MSQLLLSITLKLKLLLLFSLRYQKRIQFRYQKRFPALLAADAMEAGYSSPKFSSRISTASAVYEAPLQEKEDKLVIEFKLTEIYTN